MTLLKTEFERCLKKYPCPPTHTTKESEGKIKQAKIKLKEYGGENYLCSLARKGYTAQEVKKKFNLSADEFTQLCKQEIGMTYSELTKNTSRFNRKINQINEKGGIDYLLQCKQEGKTVRDIQIEMGLASPSSIYRFLTKNGCRWKTL